MTELYLLFTNESGEEERILVDSEKFTVGRHTENNLSIINSRLSRKHIKIERFAEVYVVSDMDSSNGTKFNENDLTDPVSLNDGDKLNLGGGLEMAVEMISDNPYAGNGSAGSSANANDSTANAETDPKSSNEIGDLVGNTGGSVNSPSPGVTGKSGISSLGMFFIIAPLMSLTVLLLLGGAWFFLSDRGSTDVTQNNENEFISTSKEDNIFLDEVPENLSSSDDSSTSVDPLPDSTQTDQTSVSGDTQTGNSTDSTTSTTIIDTTKGIETISTPVKREVKETDKIREPALAFMRKIALKDPRPVLTTKQLSVINAKAKQYQGSDALAANIKDAKANAAQLETLARSKNLPTQFVVNAALAKLGNGRGNVLTTAQGMIEVLQNLSISIGNELSNDSLLIIAAYNQGVADKNLEMRNTLAKLSSQNPTVSSRQVRTIWFLRDKNELSDAQFELALRFLAIGTITQNPKAFNVNAEALSFN